MVLIRVRGIIQLTRKTDDSLKMIKKKSKLLVTIYHLLNVECKVTSLENSSLHEKGQPLT